MPRRMQLMPKALELVCGGCGATNLGHPTHCIACRAVLPVLIPRPCKWCGVANIGPQPDCLVCERPLAPLAGQVKRTWRWQPAPTPVAKPTPMANPKPVPIPKPMPQPAPAPQPIVPPPTVPLCPHCQRPRKPGKFCTGCGYKFEASAPPPPPLPRFCPHCGRPAGPQQKFCAADGTRIP